MSLREPHGHPARVEVEGASWRASVSGGPALVIGVVVIIVAAALGWKLLDLALPASPAERRHEAASSD